MSIASCWHSFEQGCLSRTVNIRIVNIIEPTGGQFLNFFTLHDAFPFFLSTLIELKKVCQGKVDFFCLFDNSSSSPCLESDFNLFDTYVNQKI
jgi:hypothetical protein